MSRYRQRLLCDPKIRFQPRFKTKAPSSGKRYFDPKYWNRKPTEVPPEAAIVEEKNTAMID